MTQVSYSTLNNLQEVSFIAGHTYSFDFNIYQNGEMVTMVGKSLEWRLAPYGEKNYVSLVKTEGDGVVDVDSFTKRVTLSPSDTENLSGKFVQQPIVTDFDGNVFKPGQGIVVILSGIPNS